MKKRTTTLLLALVFVLSVLSGCGLPAAEQADGGEAFSPALQSGTLYAVYNESGALAAFLQLTGRELAVYTAEGEKAADLTCTFSEDDGYYYLDGQQSFSVRDRRDSMTLIARASVLFEAGSYTLSPSELPSGTEGSAPVEETPAPAEEPAETGAPQPAEEQPAETAAPEPAEAAVLTPAGSSYAVYEGDRLSNYLSLGEDTITFYYDNGDVSYEGGYTYDADLPALLVGGETLALTLEEGVLTMQEGGSLFRLEEIAAEEIPVPAVDVPIPDTEEWGEAVLASDDTGALLALLPQELLEDFVSDGNEASLYYITDDGAFYLSAFRYSGEDMERALAQLELDGEELTEEAVFAAYQEELLAEFTESMEAQGLTVESETSTARLHGTEWTWLNAFGGYQEGQISDLYMFFTMDDTQMSLVMVLASASGEGEGYQEAVDQLVYGWLQSIPLSLTLETAE